MVKKRLIFTLLYQHHGFMLSRNFRLQRAGDIQWLKSNYNFANIAFTIDELIILDVSRSQRQPELFCNHIKAIAEECFIPIAAGGGITSHTQAKAILHAGADKIVVNTVLHREPAFVRELVGLYGSQCIIASIDVKKKGNHVGIYMENGSGEIPLSFSEYIDHILALGVGEIYLNSMDKDGTGHGYLFELLSLLEQKVNLPVIVAGGAGNWHHLLEGLEHDHVDAVATANLFNFIGNGFPNARQQLLNHGMNLAKWELTDFGTLRNCLSQQ